MTHERKHSSHWRSDSIAPTPPGPPGAVRRGAQFVPLDVKNKANDVTTLLLRADAGRRSHVSNCFLLHYLWVSGLAFTFESLEKEKPKKTFPTLDVVIITRTHTSMHTHKQAREYHGVATRHPRCEEAVRLLIFAVCAMPCCTAERHFAVHVLLLMGFDIAQPTIRGRKTTTY